MDNHAPSLPMPAVVDSESMATSRADLDSLAHQPAGPTDGLVPAGPGPVNGALAKNSFLFPLDASWVDMHHDKGQLARATGPWAQMLFEKRLSDGESPQALATQCWIMAFSGLMHGLGHFDLLVSMRPEAVNALLDPEASKEHLLLMAAALEKASVSWSPPTDMALRGWSKLRSERDIQIQSRSKFAWIARLCSRAAIIGIPETLRRCAKRDLAWLGEPTAHDEAAAEAAGQPSNRWSSQPQVPHIALSFMVKARRACWEKAPPATPEQLIDLLGLACMGFSPKNFRGALTLLCPEPIDRARVGGSAARRAALETSSQLLEIRERVELIEEATRSAQQTAMLAVQGALAEWLGVEVASDNVAGALGALLDNAQDDGPDDCRRAIAMAALPFARERQALRAEERELGQRAERARDALAHLSNWSQSQTSAPGGLARDFFESTIGCPFPAPSANARAEAIILASPSRLKLSNYALGLAQCARDDGHPLDISPAARVAVWESHNQAFKSMATTNIPKGFATRHLALALNFPHEEGERLSRQIAPAHLLAEIEFSEISRLVARHVPDLLGEDDGDDPPPPARRLRL